jgi:aryl sulfotransferase
LTSVGTVDVVEDVIPPTRVRRHVYDDSRRWERFVPRVDDIFISTPPKSGTTWTQGIVSSLLWPDGDAPAPAFDVSPWVDARIVPADEMMARLEAIPHRRFLKTHSPADTTPIFKRCRYLAVYRDGRDALVSWANHRAKMRPEIIEALNPLAAADGIAPWPPRWNGDLDVLFDEWVDWGTPMEHLASWWPFRHEPFVLLVHYADLLADLEGEMRRIAEYLEIDVPSDRWPGAVHRCGFESMRDQHGAGSLLQRAFEGGESAFFHRGTNGRWREVLNAKQLARHDALVAEDLSPGAAAWLEHGSLALGRRPDESDQG